MGANEPRLSVSQRAAAEAFKHDQTLLRAAHKAQRVLYRGNYRFVQCMRIDLSGGGVETVVYLTGSPEPIPASELTLAPEIS